jgi:hypothetical protein
MRCRAPCWTLGVVLLALLAGAAAAAGADLPAAKAFVERLYGSYREVHGDPRAGPDFLGRDAPHVFSPRMIALIRRDERMTKPGYVGALDGDPISDCQDWGNISARVSVSSNGPRRAVAVARFVNLGRHETITLDLLAVRGQWRIDNIHSQTIPDLVAFLRKHAGGR